MLLADSLELAYVFCGSLCNTLYDDDYDILLRGAA